MYPIILEMFLKRSKVVAHNSKTKIFYTYKFRKISNQMTNLSKVQKLENEVLWIEFKMRFFTSTALVS